MAPRRGGGGGFSTSSSTCSDNYAFYSTYSRAIIADYAIVTFFTFILLAVYGSIRKKNPASKSILNWALGWALFLHFVNNIILIIIDCLVECGSIDLYTQYYVQIAILIIFRIENILRLYILLITLPIFFQNLLAGTTNMIKIGYGLILGVLICLSIAQIAIASYNYVNYWANDNYFSMRSSDLINDQTRLGAALNILQMVAILGASAHLLFLLTRAKSRSLIKSLMLIGIALFCFFFFASIVLSVVSYTYYGLQDHFMTINSSLAFTYVGDFFDLFSYAFLLVAGTAVGRVAGGAPAVYANEDEAVPPYQQPYQKTYEQPQNGYGYQAQSQQAYGHHAPEIVR